MNMGLNMNIFSMNISCHGCYFLIFSLKINYFELAARFSHFPRSFIAHLLRMGTALSSVIFWKVTCPKLLMRSIGKIMKMQHEYNVVIWKLEKLNFKIRKIKKFRG